MEFKRPYKVFAGTQSRYLGEEICKNLNCPLGNCSVNRFADGEFVVCFEESVRGCDVFLIQSTIAPVDNLMELLLMVDAAKRASAHRIIAVMPYFGWARQDRKDKPRVPIGAKLVADMLSVAGIDRLVTMDLHADQIQGFFDIPVDHIYGSLVLIPYIAELGLEDLIIAAPDVGASKRAAAFSKRLNVPLVLCNKTRARANVVESIQIIGDVKDKNVVIVDDLVDTAGTITTAANEMKKAGATPNDRFPIGKMSGLALVRQGGELVLDGTWCDDLDLKAVWAADVLTWSNAEAHVAESNGVYAGAWSLTIPVSSSLPEGAEVVLDEIAFSIVNPHLYPKTAEYLAVQPVGGETVVSAARVYGYDALTQEYPVSAADRLANGRVKVVYSFDGLIVRAGDVGRVWFATSSGAQAAGFLRLRRSLGPGDAVFGNCEVPGGTLTPKSEAYLNYCPVYEIKGHAAEGGADE